MALAMVKLFIIGLSTLISFATSVLFKGSAVLIVVLLRLLQLPGWLVNCVLCVLREGLVNLFQTFLTVVQAGVMSVANEASSLFNSLLSSNSTAAKTEALFNVTREVSAKNVVSNSTGSFVDAVKFVFKYAMA